MPLEMIERIIEDRKTVQARAQQPATLFDHGGDRKSEAVNQGVNHTLIDLGSGKAEYDTARIARGRPDILERMRDGEFPSVHAAAKEAGIAKKRVSISLDPDSAARTIRRHSDAAQVVATAARPTTH